MLDTILRQIIRAAMEIIPIDEERKAAVFRRILGEEKNKREEMR